MFKKLNVNQAIKYYNYISEKYSDEDIEYRIKKLESVMDPDEYEKFDFELFIEKHDKSHDKSIKSSTEEFYHHIFKALSQPWEVHTSFYDTVYKEYKQIQKYYDNTNSKNMLHNNLDTYIENGYKKAIKQMNNDTRAVKNLKTKIYNNSKYDFTKFDDLCNEKYLREFICIVYEDLYGLDDFYVKRSLELFDRYFKTSNKEKLK